MNKSTLQGITLENVDRIVEDFYTKGNGDCLAARTAFIKRENMIKDIEKAKQLTDTPAAMAARKYRMAQAVFLDLDPDQL